MCELCLLGVCWCLFELCWPLVSFVLCVARLLACSLAFSAKFSCDMIVSFVVFSLLWAGLFCDVASYACYVCVGFV